MLCLFNGLKQGLNSLVTNRFTSMYASIPQKHNLAEIHIRAVLSWNFQPVFQSFSRQWIRTKIPKYSRTLK